MNNLPNKERETHLNMVADDRGNWTCYTDDPVMAARLDKIATGTPTGFGKEYQLRADQVVLRKGKRNVSEEQRQAMGQRMRAIRQRQGATVSAEANQGIVDTVTA